MTELDFEGIWKETLIQLQKDLGEEDFSGWFSEVKFLNSRTDEKTGQNYIIIGVPSVFHRDKVKILFQNNILSILKKVSGKEIILEYEITRKKTSKSASHSQSEPEKAENSLKTTDIQPAQKKKREKHPLMRDDYTFERFVVGENNAFAVNAANAISKNPGKVYNPFLIFGGVGLGKTHLMQAIGHYIHENLDHEVIYITSEDFLNEYMQAIQEGRMNAFKNKFRYTDVLLIDDIQFFKEKPGVQEELFHTFNALLGAKKHIVFTCDRPPSELKKFDERLRSRFEQCLKVDLLPPRYEERCAILKSTAERRKANIPNEVIDLVGKHISSNVRDLISALETLIAYTELMGKPITIEIAQQRLKSNFYSPKQANLSMDNIIRVVAEYFSLTPNDLKGKKRSQNIVFARQLAMYIAMEMTEYSTTEVGQDFGGRDHTTVMHSRDRIKGRLITDPTLESTIEALKQKIKEFSVNY